MSPHASQVPYHAWISPNKEQNMSKLYVHRELQRDPIDHRLYEHEIKYISDTVKGLEFVARSLIVEHHYFII